MRVFKTERFGWSYQKTSTLNKRLLICTHSAGLHDNMTHALQVKVCSAWHSPELLQGDLLPQHVLLFDERAGAAPSAVVLSLISNVEKQPLVLWCTGRGLQVCSIRDAAYASLRCVHCFTLLLAPIRVPTSCW